MDGNNVNKTISTDEYTELKRQEKAEVFGLLSGATQKLISPEGLRAYADKQAQLFRHSVSNVLLIMAQDPEATWVRTYDDWKKDGVMVLKGENGIKTLGSYRYQKEDGTVGVGSKVVKMFDVKQTAIRDFEIRRPSYSKVPEAIMNVYPVAVEVSELPDGELAVYDPDDRLIRVKEGLTAFAKKYPDLCKLTVDDVDFDSVTYEIQKSRVSIRIVAPYSDERRKAASEYAKKNGIKQHKR